MDDHARVALDGMDENIVPVPSKGDLTWLTNYRVISMMLTSAKVYSKVLLNRRRPMVEPKVQVNQAGYLKQ